MAVSLLRNLGVDETIVQALRKSCGEELAGLQIEKDDEDLRLLVKCSEGSCKTPHVVTIQRFFEKKTFADALEPDEGGSTSQYKCRDKITFLPDDNSGQCNVKINGHDMKLSAASFQLLLRLAQELKKGAGGWVFVQDMMEDEIIPSDGYQPFSRLRSALAGYLIDKNPKDFLECNGRKQYRISSNPDNITMLDEEKK
jgi:hypothetical protein